MIGYKAFDKDLKCRGFQFEVGKTYSTGKDELELCTDTAFHFCRELTKINSVSAYDVSKDRVCEVIATGDIVSEGDKFGTNEIMILRELPEDEKLAFCNTGGNNHGFKNSGCRNLGSFNSGSNNNGCVNVGNRNNGNFNTAHNNEGHNNSGNHNVGDGNVGDSNEGDYNSGHCNSGSWNSGGWNSCDRGSGFFNSEPGKLRMFNKLTNIRNLGNIKFPGFLYFKLTKWVPQSEATGEEWEEHGEEIEGAGGFLKTIPYKEAFGMAYGGASEEERGMLFSLPNFDPGVFEEISGLDVSREYEEWKARQN